MSDNTASVTTPAYIKLKKDSVCVRRQHVKCPRVIKAGNLAFYFSKPTYATVCFYCGDEAWKAEGSNFDYRKKLAMSYQETKTSEEPSVDLAKERIRAALVRFRQELVIHEDKLHLDRETFQFLIKNKLIDMTIGGRSFCIVPKGFNWNVDTGQVEFPKPENEDDGKPAWQIRLERGEDV